jgi:hypothetical protein
MDFLYLLLNDGEWEDTIVYLNEEDAINASIFFPTLRVEIFTKTGKSGFVPSYNYYKNGVKILLSNYDVENNVPTSY